MSLLIFGAKIRHAKVFDSWILLEWLCSKVMVRFVELARLAIDGHGSSLVY